MIKLQDNPLLFDYNVEKRVSDFINASITQVISYLVEYIFLDYYLRPKGSS